MNNLTKRIITGTLFGLVMISGILISFYSCLILFSIILFLLSLEYLKLIGMSQNNSILYAVISTFIFAFFSYLEVSPNKIIALVIIVLVTLLALRELKMNRSKSLLINRPISFGLLYLIIPFYFLLKSNDAGYGHHILFFFVVVWASDTFAYFAGSAFGRRKLWPSISPKKTIEGLFGGIIGNEEQLQFLK